MQKYVGRHHYRVGAAPLVENCISKQRMPPEPTIKRARARLRALGYKFANKDFAGQAGLAAMNALIVQLEAQRRFSWVAGLLLVAAVIFVMMERVFDLAPDASNSGAGAADGYNSNILVSVGEATSSGAAESKIASDDQHVSANAAGRSVAGATSGGADGGDLPGCEEGCARFADALSENALDSG